MTTALTGEQVISVAPESRWRLALPLLALLCGWILYWYAGTAEAMIGIWWRSGTFNHAFLVPPISLWLIWRQREALSRYTPEPDLRALGLLVLAGFAWLLGQLAAINVVTQFALVGMLVLSVPTILGWRLARAMVFPLGFLFFSVPFGEFVMPKMMDLTAYFTVVALKLTGIPVYREGLHFIIPTGAWSVIEACSGIRYLIASIVVGTLYAYLNYRSLTKRLLFIAFSIAVPLVANWVRAYLIVMLAYLSGNRLATGVDHIIYGWLFFGIVIMIMFLVGWRWSDDEELPGNPDPTQPGVRARIHPRRLTAAAMGAALVAMFPPLWFHYVDGAAPASSWVEQLEPFQVEGWQREDQPLVRWKPAFQNPSAESQNEFTQGNQRAGVYLEYYRGQNFKHKLVSSENVFVRTQDPIWLWDARGSRQIQIGSRSIAVPWAELHSVEGQRLEVMRWYWVNGLTTANDALAKLYVAWFKLTGQGDDSAAVILYAPKAQPDGGVAALDSFAKSAWPSIQAELQAVRARRAE